jgi:hypothetical protein
MVGARRSVSGAFSSGSGHHHHSGGPGTGAVHDAAVAR